MWLKRVEDMLYFETDDALGKADVLEFGQRLRKGYYSRLAEFADQIELVDNPDLYPLHADFLSRLGLTFSHGDYAMHPQITNSQSTAVMLFKKALDFHPDHRAFWGLGLVYQHLRQFDKSVAILRQGIVHHKTSVDLHTALANSLMRLKRYPDAIEWLKSVADHPQALELLVRCCRFMGDRQAEYHWTEALKRHQKR
jgi:tetratricopeptide (TPR) repeat protein